MTDTNNYPMGVNGSSTYFSQDDPPECLNKHCMATLETDWEFCPYCGWHINWDEYERQSNEPDWYAEEGEAFYRSECIGGAKWA